jgi:hypothetical protein
MLDVPPARRALVLAVAIVSVLAVALPAVAAESASSKRPTAAAVKRALTKTWGTDYKTSVDTVTVQFKSLRLLTTRRSVPNRDFIEPGKWVTPVAAVFDQKTVRRSYDILSDTNTRECSIYRVNFTGIFWRGDFGWSYKNRDVASKRTSSSC